MTAQLVRAPLPLVESFESIADRSPDRVALVEGGSTIGFGEVAERVEALASAFGDAGITPGQRVAVLLPNGASFPIVLFGLWRVGAVAVPLHVRFLEHEILRYVDDCGVIGIVTTQRMSSLVELVQRRDGRVRHAWLWPSDEREPRYVGVNADRSDEAVAASEVPETAADWPAITQYSTGSTGFSKRVTRSHGQLLGEVECVSKLMGLGPDDRVLGVAPFFHSYGLVNALLCGLLSGASVFAENDFFPRDIAALVEDEGLTALPGVPFMYQLLAELAVESDFSTIRYALSAGAPLSAGTAEAFRERTGRSIRQLYGTTETGVISVEREPSAEPSVGLPIPGVSVRVLDDRGYERSEGGIGNVAVSSPYAASGYDNPETSTESVFRNGLFMPGDLGRIDSDGRLVLEGRRRGFINVAGNKVDPTEVETVLKQMPAVSEAVVVAVPDGAADEKVKAVIVASGPCTRADIFEHCRARLADFKRPRLIEFRKEMPRSPLGKVLRKYLIDDESVGGARYVFDPGTGFSTREDGSPGEPETSDLSTLAPFLRTLLVTDGTVTKNLEAYFWEPIDVELILHVEEESEDDYPDIEVERGDPILKRRVVLRGRVTHSAYAVCEAITACDRLSSSFRRRLVEGQKGIGELMREWRWETYRELLGVDRMQAGEWSAYLNVGSTEKVAARSYRISHDGPPLIQITEVFPESRFDSLV